MAVPGVEVRLPPAVVPLISAPYRVVPAPRPVVGSPAARLDDGWPAAVRRRLERLADDADGVLVRASSDPDGVEQALRHAWRLLPVADESCEQKEQSRTRHPRSHPPEHPAGLLPEHHPTEHPTEHSTGHSIEHLPEHSTGHPTEHLPWPPSAGASAPLQRPTTWDPAAPPPTSVRLAHLGLVVDLEALTCRRLGTTGSDEATELLLRSCGPELLLLGWLLACSDDLVVLRRAADGELAAELLAVAFPSGWAPRRVAGASLHQLHAPVADNARLQRAAPALTEALLTKGPLHQHVWGLEPSGRLDDDPSAPDARGPGRPDDPADWWLRVEEQTSVPLPALDRALFLIRPHLRPLASLVPQQRLALADALDGMSTAARVYKGVDGHVERLVPWLRQP